MGTIVTGVRDDEAVVLWSLNREPDNALRVQFHGRSGPLRVTTIPAERADMIEFPFGLRDQLNGRPISGRELLAIIDAVWVLAVWAVDADRVPESFRKRWAAESLTFHNYTVMLNKFDIGYLRHVRPGTPEARLAELVDEVGGLLPALTVGAAYPILGEIDPWSEFHVYWAKIASRTFRIAALLAEMRYALVRLEAAPYRSLPEIEPEIWR